MPCFCAGIPFGSVNLLHGVDKHESKVKKPSPMLPILFLEYVGLEPGHWSTTVADNFKWYMWSKMRKKLAKRWFGNCVAPLFSFWKT